ncbi:Bax inhibitor-1/YccA family protein [Gardnerella sp. DNF00354]|uniref:Inhibitor of apoptosis-promoting Bax1 n=1 Tax=Gardnerella vaginalis JCP8108 TaxID=1261066 RepID=S4GED6_GARVA|nr:Bax inhibitor-1/YccA family protein [Gardnerella vaginalis]EPI46152.1 hypothetical protein HMPREF1581_01127 [Gardnerella vaginalis JCP8108]
MGDFGNFNSNYAGNFAQNPTIVDAQATYVREQAERVSVRRVYAEMTVGLIVTTLVAMFTQSTGALYYYLYATGRFGFFGIIIAQVALAVILGMRVMKMSVFAARAMFYAYAALTGFTLSAIFTVFSLGSIAMVLALTAGFFLCLTMLALTTKVNMLKAGPILMVALLVLCVSQVILMFVAPSAGTMRLIAAIAVLIFAGLTAYDAQKTRAIFEAYADQPEMIKRISIICAFNLYLDFINMFVYLLELLGNRRD